MRRNTSGPKRRIAPTGRFAQTELSALLARAAYVGSAVHKRRPGDYRFHPAVNPRASKSLCDGLRTVLKAEAEALLEAGIRKGMVSEHREDGLPKYVWAVDGHGEAYEAKLGNGGYHGYRLDPADEPDMRTLVLREWKARP